MTQLKNAMQPSVSEVVVTWEGIVNESDSIVAENPELEMTKTLLGFMKPKKTGKSEGKKVFSLHGQAPLQIPPIYDGTRLLVYRLFEAEDGKLPTMVKITAQTPDGPLSVELPIEKSCLLDGNFVHQLAARKRIQDLVETVSVEEEGGVKKEDVEKAIVELGIKYRLASKHTSFVGVDDKAAKGDFELAMNTRDIKNQVPSGFGYGMPMAMACREMTSMSARSTLPICGSGPQGGGMIEYRKYSVCSNMKWAVMSESAPRRVSNKKCLKKRKTRMAAFMMANHAQVESASCPGRDEMGDFAMDWVSTDSPGMPMEQKAAVQEEDKLTPLINLQSSDGHFKYGDVITRCTGKSNDELAAKQPSFVTDNDLWLTAIVIALLEAMTNEKDLWELVVQKARKYLSNRLKDKEMEKIIEAARQI
jgi:hypothetical protein